MTDKILKESNLVIVPDPGTAAGNLHAGRGAAEKTYTANSFDPATADTGLTYTPGRVARYMYNRYQPTPGYKVFGYLSDWGIYDGRYGENFDDQNVDYRIGGRGTDIMRLLTPNGSPPLYDKIIVGFTAIIGDQGANEDTINAAALDFKIASSPGDLPAQRGRATFTDPWGDVAAYVNCGFNSWISNDYPMLFDANRAQGVLGALVKLHRQSPSMTIGMSLGGWTMSQAFHHIAKEPIAREKLAESLKNIVIKFPMFTELDLDWEYPGVEGAPGNDYGPEDADNYALLIRAIKDALPNVKISIATIAVPEKLEQANIPKLIEAGVEGLNVMTYDFFGSPWADRLMHHTNLFRPLTGFTPPLNSANDAVSYLIGLGIDSKMINIGFASYTRNAQRAEIERTSPLTGRYEPRQPNEDNTVGSFEAALTEWPDLLRLYLDEDLEGINGFELHRDAQCKAEFLYNDQTGVFMSIETPRTVLEKARYVKDNNLGGLFLWMIDSDNGLLTNAAREGLGAQLVAPATVDMARFYNPGKNARSDEKS
ncbi:hypothetical protein J3P88_06200 [Pseudomonas sp. Z3-6]|uniref:glycosyl hydrolase family 18 protein n=1 Tax=Pseudomonas sp. Z3-6 TaxID=2817411 RepID=UPI003DA9D5DA